MPLTTGLHLVNMQESEEKNVKFKLLAIVLCAFLLVSCGGFMNNETTEKKSDVSTVSTTESVITQEIINTESSTENATESVVTEPATTEKVTETEVTEPTTTEKTTESETTEEVKTEETTEEPFPENVVLPRDEF